MSTIVVSDLAREYRDRLQKTKLRKQLGQDEAGQMRMLYRLDIDAEDFDAQFGKAFTLSVSEARKRHNGKLAGKRARSK